ncbi:unnamed protein product [Pseudo-nitzschia multistriata]|uniref:Uncharacterized protein n=1 Tax=Pseudo-nitzschia multistriata TaxID=183589 RepID=A0A448Z136_9STRA|nr:unnamed protein product [Pseudo-nitzschia multistriata]
MRATSRDTKAVFSPQFMTTRLRIFKVVFGTVALLLDRIGTLRDFIETPLIFDDELCIPIASLLLVLRGATRMSVSLLLDLRGAARTKEPELSLFDDR